MSAPEDANYRVEFDWRGETAYYVELSRRVLMSCAYWGGPTGSVSHFFGYWELPDGRREPLTTAERELVLERVVERAATAHGIELKISGE